MDLLLAGACALTSATREVVRDGSGWLDHAVFEVGTSESCPAVDLALPPGVELVELDARVRLSDDTRRKVRGPRLDPRPDLEGGASRVRLHTPDLAPGDALRVEVTRRWTTEGRGAWSWDGERFSRSDPEGSPSDPGGRGPAAVAVREELVVPEPFQRTLYPGGGSSLRSSWTVRFDADDSPASFGVPVPPTATAIEVDGPYVRHPASVELRVAAGESAERTVRFTAPDAPTHGPRVRVEGAEVEHAVVLAGDEGGRIRWERDEAWWLASIGLQAVLPERPQLLVALDNRFRRAALPEPALPWSLRALPADLALAAALRPILHDRSGVGDLPVDPLFPRRLVRARKSGALTSVEAALILAFQLQQARFPATWALARPASEGPGFHTAPTGYRVGLTAFEHEGAIWWIDPSCRVCAPFEVHPDLEGADVLSPVATRTPGPREGSLTVRDAGDTRAVTLDGPAALDLRLRLAALPPDQREAWLAERFAAATFVSSEGVTSPGATVELAFSQPSPFDLAAHDGASAWWGWVGERRWERPATDSDVDRHEHEGPLCWTLRVADGVATERLMVSDRAVDPQLAARLAASRSRDISRPD